MTAPDESPPPRRERSGLVVSSGWVIFALLLGTTITGYAIYAIIQSAR